MGRAFAGRKGRKGCPAVLSGAATLLRLQPPTPFGACPGHGFRCYRLCRDPLASLKRHLVRCPERARSSNQAGRNELGLIATNETAPGRSWAGSQRTNLRRLFDLSTPFLRVTLNYRAPHGSDLGAPWSPWFCCTSGNRHAGKKHPATKRDGGKLKYNQRSCSVSLRGVASPPLSLGCGQQLR